MKRRAWTSISIGLALFIAPAAAEAATTVSVQQVPDEQGGTLNVVVAQDDDSAADMDARLFSNNSNQHFVIVENSKGAAPADASCFPDGGSTTQVACAGDFDALVIFGNGGADQVAIDQTYADLPPLYAEVYGGEGNDKLEAPTVFVDEQPQLYMEGGNGSDTMRGGNGPDELHGGDGNDTIAANEGPDAVYGEGGDDSVAAGGDDAADVVDGGPGFDRIPDIGNDYSRGFVDDVSITLDGQANDGEPAEGDNVLGVEKLTVLANHATVVGDDGPNDFLVDANASTIRGLGGNDRLVGHDGNDVIEGGDGDDYLEGGFGNDILDGGTGIDQFVGDTTERNVIATGNDQIHARDGASEQVDCGIGSDVAQVDASDVVDASCESVDRGAGPPAGGGGGSGSGPGGSTTGGAGGTLKVLGKLSVRSIAAHGLAILVPCAGACQVKAELRVDKATARKLKLGRSRVLARGAKTLLAAGDAKLTLKVLSKARKRFKRLRKASLTLVTKTKTAGKTTTTTKKLKVKR